MAQFHPLKVTDIHHTIRDAVVLTLEPENADAFAFTQGQYLTFKRDFGGTELRRNYSICTGLDDGEIKVGDGAQLIVDHERRNKLRSNHSATHLVHEALRQVLGDHVAQKGSLVAPDRLRFDFAHPKPVEVDEMQRVDAMANANAVRPSAIMSGSHLSRSWCSRGMILPSLAVRA